MTGALMVCLGTAALAEEKAAAPDAKAIRSLEVKSFVIPGANGIKMMLIPGGTFTMGSPSREDGRGDDEKAHKVSISKPFYMAATETSQRQYLSIMVPGYEEYAFGGYLPKGKKPKLYEDSPYLVPKGSDRDMSQRPMDGVTWAKANTFCAKLTAAERKAGRLPKGYVYRLPTEAEWEYACRAGTDSLYGVDNKELARFCICHENAADGKPIDVATYRVPNAWGLYDMHGNIYEWCHDWYGPYPKGKASDPTGPKEGERRVARGGCFNSGKGAEHLPEVKDFKLRYIRSASRNHFLPTLRMSILGVRVVLAPEL
jgi:formylglycine-generating enzyme required for sulfatase activity